MPSIRPARSSSSAGAIYLDREARLAELRAMAQRAAERMPEIRHVWLFGSLTTGIATPRSDADLLVEVADSPHHLCRDRIPDLLRVLAPLPCSVDLFVFTSVEIRRLDEEGSPLIETALRRGTDLLGSPGGRRS